MSTPHPDQGPLTDLTEVKLSVKTTDLEGVDAKIGDGWDFTVYGTVTAKGERQTPDGVVKPTLVVTAYDIKPKGEPRRPRPTPDLFSDDDGGDE